MTDIKGMRSVAERAVIAYRQHQETLIISELLSQCLDDHQDGVLSDDELRGLLGDIGRLALTVLRAHDLAKMPDPTATHRKH